MNTFPSPTYQGFVVSRPERAPNPPLLSTRANHCELIDNYGPAEPKIEEFINGELETVRIYSKIRKIQRRVICIVGMPLSNMRHRLHKQAISMLRATCYNMQTNKGVLPSNPYQ